MGVPKFYRWVSERYPNISRVINDNQIPDFDNFYLDMNGIIHACSHVNEDNCETNVTEEEIFRNIFHYIDFLFRMIKPKKVFFMAVDGVAPRAKMNQQRARRFRAGRDRIKKLKTLAEKTGQTLKETISHHFDTNAITPGTTFMANLDEQLKYFINVKLTTDPLWSGVDIHLSGHLTPGEGEHKIMEYIRYTRSQPGYDVNTRHCLYGLDADLIMLGLVTHEMHFALLREEVKYGPKKISKILTPEEINWHLLQLCLLRDYIDLEFRSVKEKLKFPYDLENIVDDWILMGYLVGNDFIPHLPHVHINQEALPLLWEAYKKVLPTLEGYMNENGELNLSRFEIYLTELSKYDYEHFEKEGDSGKQLDRLNSRNQKKSELDKDQIPNSGFSIEILEKLMITTPINPKKESNGKTEIDTNGQLIDSFIAHERKSPNISSSSSSDDVHPPVYPDADDDGPSSDSERTSDNNNNNNDDEKKKILRMTSNEKRDYMSTIQAEFRQHKNHYYQDKMRCESMSTEQLSLYVQQYIEALQWILKYYYQGCPSWSWFYPHHYAPYLSDLNNFKHFQFPFQRGTPFKPFEQLLGVLPPTSRYLLPTGLQSLMIDDDSPLLHFYPEDFQLDQNEKKQDWESIVLLPFIEEELLLNSIQKYYLNLDADEKIRNQHLPSLCFKSTPTLHPTSNIIANNPYFPPLKETCAVCTEYSLDYYRPDGLIFKHGRFDEANMIYFPKFPVLNVLPYKFEFKKGVVDLFESRSKSTTLALNLTYQPDPDCIQYDDKWDPKDNDNNSSFQITNRQLLIERYLGKRIFVNWPHFEYGIVCAISDFRHFYTWSNIPGGSHFSFRSSINDDTHENKNYTQTPIYVSRYPFEISDENNKSIAIKTYTLDSMQSQMEYTKAITINRRYENRQGVMIGPIPLLLYVCPLIGYRTKCSSTSDKCQTTMCFSNQAMAYPLQTSISTITNYKYDLFQFPRTIYEGFKKDDPIFSLQTPYYSCMSYVQQIIKDNNGKYTVECRMEPSDATNQPDLHALSNRLDRLQLNYWTAQQVAEYLRTMPNVVSKLTGTIIITTGTGRRENINRVNVGFSWKANKPIKQLYGYTKKEEQVWLYSDAAVLIISDYMLQFPEIIATLVKNPKDDTYPELNIWPARKGRSRLEEVRTWIKKLPTYSVPLMDGAWQVLDAPVIKEIDRSTKSYFSKNPIKNSNEKTKLIPIEANRIFKPNESFGMCDPDIETRYELYDRVITVRLGTGVPLGTRGTIIGIMLGQTHLDAYYEVLFDNLPKTSLDAILLGGNNQQCRIKVRSYHLLNYSHSLRIRSNTNYSQARSMPNENAWEKRLLEQPSTSRQAQQQQQQQQQPPPPTRILKRTANENNSATTPKSAPAATSAPAKPNFIEVINSTLKEQQSAVNSSSPITTEKSKPSESPSTTRSLLPTSSSEQSSVLLPSPIDKRPDLEKIFSSVNSVLPVTNEQTTSLTTFPSQPGPVSLFLRAIQESKQVQNSSQQQPTSIQQQWDTIPPPPIPIIQQKHNEIPISVQQSQKIIPTSQQQQQSYDPFVPRQQTWESPPRQQLSQTLFAQAIENMTRAPPSSLLPSQFEQQSPLNISSPSQQQHQHQQQQQSLAFLERAIQQSNQQFNTNQTSFAISNGSMDIPPFQPFDLNLSNTYPGFPVGPLITPNVVQQQQQQPQPQSPMQSNNIRMGSPQTMSSPQTSYNSPPSQTPTTPQVNSPRMSGGSTLQFVPSQVLRNMDLIMGKLFKVLVWGKTAVGKTSLIEQLTYGRVEEKPYRETIEDTYCIQYDNSLNEKDIVLRVHDIGGVKNSPSDEFSNIRHLMTLVDALILVFDNRSNESFECCKAIKDIIEIKTTDKNKREIIPILVLCNEVVSDERRLGFNQVEAEQWTAKDKCFVGNRVWFVNLRDRARIVEAFTALMKELYKPQSKSSFTLGGKKGKTSMTSNTTTNASIESQLDCALDLMRRLPPQQVEKNLSDLIDLVPDLTEELLAAVDQPLKVVRDRAVGKDYLLCDYNRDGDSYRSPWTNTYTPAFDGNLPSDRLRQLEVEANQAFEQYREMYFEGGVSSVYFWDLENGFAGVILIKKVGDGSKKIKGCWDSIHVVEVQEKQSGRSAHYKLTSTVMLWLQTHKTMSGMMNLGGSLTRQLESDHQITDFSQHIINIGKMVEEMENKIRQTLNSIYFGKTKDILNSLRNSENFQGRVRLQQANFTGELQSALNRTRPVE
ncbi:unnamed protein product [Adineta steineri]|uniref:Uncharacterized protein n=2 Tax=Adineta steineri TaxID=433720 RepID=A0A814YL55_9BILA|nr:unnamed protein product [Adineta steineri]